MAEHVINQVIRERWISYSKKEGWKLNFGLKDFVVLVGTVTIAPNVAAMIEIIKIVLS